MTSASEQGRLRNTLQRYWPTVGCEYGKARLKPCSGVADTRTDSRAAHSLTSQNDVAETHSQLLFDVAGVCKGLVAEGGYRRVQPIARPFTILSSNSTHASALFARSDSPETLPLSGGTLRCEQCLYDSSTGESDAETRIRLVYSLQGALPATPGPCVWRLSEVEMFHERRLDVAGRNSSPATDTRTDGFALTDRTPPAALTSGYWEASSGATLSLFPGPPPTVVPVPWWGLEPKPQWATAPRCSALPAGTATLLHLPLGVWAYVEQARSDMLIVESGQVLPSGQRRVVACSYSHGALDSFVIGTDEEISLAHARAKGYITGEDAAEQAYYNDLLETLDMDSDEVRGGLTKDATPFE